MFKWVIQDIIYLSPSKYHDFISDISSDHMILQLSASK